MLPGSLKQTTAWNLQLIDGLPTYYSLMNFLEWTWWTYSWLQKLGVRTGEK